MNTAGIGMLLLSPWFKGIIRAFRWLAVLPSMLGNEDPEFHLVLPLEHLCNTNFRMKRVTVTRARVKSWNALAGK
jgi:hypothetical protein